MATVLETPTVARLDDVVSALREWQSDQAPWQLHPGDLGWFWRFGAQATAAALRTWSRDGQILAIGLLDGQALLRMTLAPGSHGDEELTRQIAFDITRPERGVLPHGAANVEAPARALIQQALAEDGWDTDEPWTPLRRDLREPVAPAGLRVDIAGPEQAPQWAEVLRASFSGSTFNDQRWHSLAAGSPYAGGRCLLGYDDHGTAVAAVAVWSAGPGRPGLIEPMGVHQDHRGRGYGQAISIAAAAALEEMGCSSAIVYTPSSNVAGVATYISAGFRPLPEVRDRRRQ